MMLRMLRMLRVRRLDRLRHSSETDHAKHRQNSNFAHRYAPRFVLRVNGIDPGSAPILRSAEKPCRRVFPANVV